MKTNLRYLNTARTSTAGLDLAITESCTFGIISEVKCIPMEVDSPLPKSIVRIILCYLHITMKGIHILLGVIDSDYTAIFKLWLSHILLSNSREWDKTCTIITLALFCAPEEKEIRKGGFESMNATLDYAN